MQRDTKPERNRSRANVILPDLASEDLEWLSNPAVLDEFLDFSSDDCTDPGQLVKGALDHYITGVPRGRTLSVGADDLGVRYINHATGLYSN